MPATRAFGGTLTEFALRYGLMTIVAAAIVYGSLYPFAFHDSGSLGADILQFAETWKRPPRSRGDTLANLLLYMPLGLTVMLALSRAGSRTLAAVLALCVGALLSVTMELAQFYDAGRVSTLSDAYLNIAGTAAGIVLAWTGRVPRVKASWPSGGAAAFARFLLLAWLGWRLYPYAPTIDLHKYWHSVKPLFSRSSIAPYDIFRYATLWLSLAFLLQVGLRPKHLTRFVLAAMVCFFTAKIVIIGQHIFPPDILGAILSLFLASLVLRRFGAIGIPLLAALMMMILVLSRVLPWQLAGTQKAFQWIPFFSFLHGSLQIDVISFAEKVYLYGAVLLLLVTAGVRLRIAIILECAVLLATSVLQIFLVRRSAEVTDALLALALGLIYALLSRQSPEKPARAPRA